MAELDLEPGEYAIASLADVTIDGSISITDMVLTNRNLLVVSKTVFGRIKGTKKYPFDQISVINGQAQVGIEKRGRNPLLVIQLKTGDRLQVSSAQKQDFEGFASTVNMLLAEAAASSSAMGKNMVDELTEAFKSALVGLDSRTRVGDETGVGSIGETRQAAQAPKAMSGRCPSCKAPISGYSGQVVTCSYCDTKQRF